MRLNKTARFAAVMAAGLIVARCSSSTPSNPTPTPTPTPTLPPVTNFVTGVTASDGTVASQQSGTPPVASGGPTITASTSSSAIPNGTDLTQLQSGTPFQSVYVSVTNTSGIAPFSLSPNRIGPLDAASGYFLLRLPAPVTTVLVLSSLGSISTGSRFTLAYAVANAGGAVGAAVTSTKTIVGQTGGVQVGVTWDTASDVDLHVIDPASNEVYWNNLSVASGGTLDVDSNAGCALDNKNNENIRWTGSAPNGTYTVRVDYWSACNLTGTTTYAVVVNNGGAISRFTGSFTANQADAGGRGSGRLITTFNHTTGISPFNTTERLAFEPLLAPSPLKQRLSGEMPR